MVPAEWADAGITADRVLTMIAAVLVARAGGAILIEHSEWTELNELFDGRGALMVVKDGDSYTVSFGTHESIAQRGADAVQ